MENLIADLFNFQALLLGFYSWKKDWSLDYVCTQFRDFIQVSSSSRSFDNSWGATYI